MKNRASQIRVESPDGEPWQHSPNRAVSDFSLQAVKDTHRCFRNAWVIWGPWFSSVYVVLSRKWGVEEKDSPPLLHSAPNTSLREGHGGFAGRAPGLAMSKYLFPLTSGLQSQQKRELFFSFEISCRSVQKLVFHKTFYLFWGIWKMLSKYFPAVTMVSSGEQIR